MNQSSAVVVIRVFVVVLFLLIIYLLGESGREYRTVVFIALASLATIEIFGIRRLNISQDVAVTGDKIVASSNNNHLVFLIIGGMAMVALAFYAFEERFQSRGTYASCIDDASKKPTEVGVRISAKECQRVFVEEPQRAESERVEASRMAIWAARHSYKLSELDAKIGERLSESAEFPCSADKKRVCTMIDWPFDGVRVLRAEVSGDQLSTSFPKPILKQ